MAEINKSTFQAYDLFRDILNQENSLSVLSIAKTIFTLRSEISNLSQKELLIFAQRINDAATNSYHAFYTEDRTGALVELLTHSNNDNFWQEYPMPDVSCDEMKDFLLSCDDDIFTDLVDYVTYYHQEYLKPDFEPEPGHIQDELTDFVNGKHKGNTTFNEMINNAKESKSESRQINQSFHIMK